MAYDLILMKLITSVKILFQIIHILKFQVVMDFGGNYLIHYTFQTINPQYRVHQYNPSEHNINKAQGACFIPGTGQVVLTGSRLIAIYLH